MSSLLDNLSEKFHNHNDTEAFELAFEHFNQSNQPYHDLFESLSILCESTHQKTLLINCLIHSFIQWRNQSNRTISIPLFDENLINNLFLKNLPIDIVEDFCEIFQISREYLLFVLRILLREPINSPAYKRALNIIVKLHYQFEFPVDEILLPLVLNTKDQLIHLYIDKNPQLQGYFLDFLNHLYDSGGKRLRDILMNEFHITNYQNVNKKALGKLAVRYWNLFGNEEKDKYPNLASLQLRRTLLYLINMKYSNANDEKTISNDAWNELVEEMVLNNSDVSEFLIESLADKDDITAVRYWMIRLNRPYDTLPNWVQRYINTKPNSRSIVSTPNQNSVSMNCYTIPSKDVPIIFIDSMNGYERLLDRLFNVNNEDDELFIGFDCEWKPIFNNTSTSKQRISIMQIAFPTEIFLLDLLYFFHTCNSQTIQLRLANRLFDDAHVTILCYGFKADASMLIASYPIFDQALSSGKTLLDLSLVQTDLMNVQRDIFPYLIKDTNITSKDKGLSELVRLCFGKSLNKSEQCSNWERRPLRNPQTLYAATDAYCLLDIYNFLRNHVQSSDYLQSFRGKVAKKIDHSTDRSQPLDDITSID